MLVDPGAAVFEKFFQLRRVEGPVVFLIQFKPDSAARFEMLRQIVEKKIPLRHAPKSGHLVIVEANHESGNDIEFLTEVREGTKRLDLLNNAADTEQARDFPEHWQAIDVETNSRMTKELRDVEKVSSAAAEIENPFRARQIEFKPTNPANVNCDPALQIQILRPICSGISDGITPMNLLEANGIDRFDDALCIQREASRSQ